MKKNVLYTTVYPAAEKYFSDWAGSVLSQDTRDFDIYIGLDTMPRTILPESLAAHFAVTYLEADAHDTPVSLRNRAMAAMAARYENIVFADSDDVLEPTRVSTALHELQSADIHGCTLRLINGHGDDLNTYFGLIEAESPDEVLPRYNFLGLSNTAWRSAALQACIPAPAQCIAMDWFLATCGWCRGLSISFDRSVRMRYRQYGANTACVVPPFTADQIVRATDIVCSHYDLLLSTDMPIAAARRAVLQSAAARARAFRQAIASSRIKLETYTSALNQRPAHRLWWQTVAHPDLEDIWNC